MTITKALIEAELSQLELPDGGNIVSRDMLRAVMIDGTSVSFVIEAPTPEMARQMEPLRAAAERAVMSLTGVDKASVLLTAHGPAAKKPATSASDGPPSLKLGGHPKGGNEPIRPAGVRSILAIASGKVALANLPYRQTLRSRWRVRAGVLDCWTPIFMGRRSRE